MFSYGHLRMVNEVLEDQKKPYVDQLADDAGCSIEDLPCLMEDREMWRDIVKRV